MKKTNYFKPLLKFLLVMGLCLFSSLSLLAQEGCSDKEVDNIYTLILSAQRNEEISQEKIVKGDMSFQADFEKTLEEWEKATELTFGGTPCLAKKVFNKIKDIPNKGETLKTFISMLEAVLKNN